MKPLLPLLCLGLALHAADLPVPRAVSPFPQNLSPAGPAIPTTAPIESAHPAAIPLWPEGAPGSESRRAEPEQISWRQEPDIVFPIISNIHQPSLTPFIPAKGKATGCAASVRASW